MRRVLAAGLALSVLWPGALAGQELPRWPAPALGSLSAPGIGTSARTSDYARDPILSGDDALIAGLFVVGTVAISPVDRRLAEVLQDPRRQENRLLRFPATALNLVGVPGSFIIGGGLYLHGLATDDRETAALGLHGLEAIVAGATTAVAIKALTGRARPHLDVTRPLDFGLGRGIAKEEFRSFPSGHAVAGFAAATVVTSETSRWWPGSEDYIGPVMYTGAALIGISRMYSNQHWASDVVMGAAVGVLAGVLINRYHRSNPDNWIDRTLLPEEGRGDALLPTARAAPRPLALWSIPLSLPR